jgi:hypothetical protein
MYVRVLLKEKKTTTGTLECLEPYPSTRVINKKCKPEGKKKLDEDIFVLFYVDAIQL